MVVEGEPDALTGRAPARIGDRDDAAAAKVILDANLKILERAQPNRTCIPPSGPGGALAPLLGVKPEAVPPGEATAIHVGEMDWHRGQVSILGSTPRPITAARRSAIDQSYGRFVPHDQWGLTAFMRACAGENGTARRPGSASGRRSQSK